MNAEQRWTRGTGKYKTQYTENGCLAVGEVLSDGSQVYRALVSAVRADFYKVTLFQGLRCRDTTGTVKYWMNVENTVLNHLHDIDRGLSRLTANKFKFPKLKDFLRNRAGALSTSKENILQRYQPGDVVVSNSEEVTLSGAVLSGALGLVLKAKHHGSIAVRFSRWPVEGADAHATSELAYFIDADWEIIDHIDLDADEIEALYKLDYDPESQLRIFPGDKVKVKGQDFEAIYNGNLDGPRENKKDPRVCLLVGSVHDVAHRYSELEKVPEPETPPKLQLTRELAEQLGLKADTYDVIYEVTEDKSVRRRTTTGQDPPSKRNPGRCAETLRGSRR